MSRFDEKQYAPIPPIHTDFDFLRYTFATTEYVCATMLDSKNKEILQNASVGTTLFSNVQSTRLRIDCRTSYLFDSQKY